MLRTIGYQAVGKGVAWSDRSHRSRLRVTGPDRARFLHNLTTNEVKRLPSGRGCETFVTSPQGKTLGYVKVLVCEDSILVTSDPDGLSAALPHLRKYGVFDEVELEELTGKTFELHIAGPRAGELLEKMGLPLPGGEELSHLTSMVSNDAVRIVREAPTGRPGFTIIGDRESKAPVIERLEGVGEGLGLVELTPEEFDSLRIEAGTPVFGCDVTEKNLPQEIGRDARAINFVKGCYLGQETVARIDALGHVNQLLRGLRFEDATGNVAPGTELEHEGVKVGVVTSSAFSPGWDATIALALVRSSHAGAGVKLRAGPGDDGSPRWATVCDLPMLPRDE
jgi:folate-binding protein YgfZ